VNRDRFWWVAAIAFVAVGCPGRFSAPGGSSTNTIPNLPPPVAAPAAREAFELVALAPAADSARVDWRRGEAAASFALFVGTDESTLFSSIPVAVDPVGEDLVVPALLPDTEYFAGIGVDSGSGFERSGPVLRVRTGVPIYVDPFADPGLADGLTPQTAYADPFSAVLAAFALGGGNLWMRAAEFTDVALPLFEGVNLYGGFTADFDLANRDLATQTVFRGRPNLAVVGAQALDSPAIVDGLLIDGMGVATSGLDFDHSPLEARNVEVRSCNRGVKLRAVGATSAVVCVFAYSDLVSNGVGGLSLDGYFDLALSSCLFEGNVQEGIDADDLVAPPGELASLSARRCRFVGNGAEGLDFDLAAPLLPSLTGGSFDIVVEDCDFIANGQAGLLIDIDYETAPAWSAEILIRGCVSRGNAGDGVTLDLDAAASTLVHRLDASANGLDGLRVRSEAHAGLATVSSSSFTGNLGAGVRSEAGNVSVLASHCAFLGNEGGGLVASVVDTSAVSSVAYLQSSPFIGTSTRASVESQDPFAAPFVNVPTAFARVIAVSGAQLTLGAAAPVAVGITCEVASDGIARAVTATGTNSVTLDSAPPGFFLPARLFCFDGIEVTRSFELSPGSIATGAGMGLDAGPFDAPGGGAPGTSGAEALFRVAQIEPTWASPVASNATIELSFAEGVPSAASLASSVFVFDALDAPVAAGVSVVGDQLLIAAPIGGWPSTFWVELHAGLMTTLGAGLAVPAAFLFETL